MPAYIHALEALPVCQPEPRDAVGEERDIGLTRFVFSARLGLGLVGFCGCVAGLGSGRAGIGCRSIGRSR